MQFNDYHFTLVQIRKAMSGEIFNIGVIGIDKLSGKKEFRHIEDLERLEKCLKVGSIDHLAYSIDRISIAIDEAMIYDVSVSNDIYVTHMVPFRHKGDLSSAVNALFEKNITIVGHNDHLSERSMYDKASIVDRVQQFIGKDKYNNVHFRKKIPYGVKKVDVVVFDDSGKHPVVAGEMASLFVTDPTMTITNSLMTLQTLKNFNVMGRILNVPLYEAMKTNKQRELYAWAKNMAKAEKHEWVDSKDPAEFFGVFEKLSDRYGGIMHINKIDESSLIGD